jgi:hypothetical protein
MEPTGFEKTNGRSKLGKTGISNLNTGILAGGVGHLRTVPISGFEKVPFFAGLQNVLCKDGTRLRMEPAFI